MSLTFPKKQLFAVLALLAAASMWYYVRCIVVPSQEKYALEFNHPRGNLSDLYPRWLGARELLLHGRDPYSRAITLEIQRGYWGREVDPSRPQDPKDQQAFAYPVFVVFLLAPTVHMDFVAVRLLFLWLLASCTVLSVLLWERTLGFEMLEWRTLTVVFLLLGSYPFAEALSVQQPILLVAVLLAGSFLARQSGWLFLSGVLLAVATIKPQVAVLPVVLMLMWVSAEWRERQRWLWGFAATMALLLGASEYILPGWLFRFYDAVRAYNSYMGGTAFLDWFVTPRWSGIVRAILVLVVLWIGWKSRRLAPDAMAARRAVSLALVAVVCIAPNLATYNQVLLLPGLLLLLDQQKVLQHSGMVARNLSKIVLVLFVWPWLVCITLIVAKMVFHAESFVQWAWQMPLYTTLSLPVALLALLLLWPFDTVSTQRTFPSPEMLA